MLLPPALPALGVAGVSSLVDLLLVMSPEFLRPPLAMERTVALFQGSILPSDLSRLHEAKADLDSIVHGADLADPSKEDPTSWGEKIAALMIRTKEKDPGTDHLWTSFQYLMGALLMKDPTTFWHSMRVAQRLVGFATYLGEVSDRPADVTKRYELLVGGALHDIGKLGVPNDILTNKHRLSPAEWRLMKSHPLVGNALCHRLGFSPDILSMILYHHEQWGGDGYPYQLAREEIPFWARLVSVVDVYDALINTRPYHPGISPHRAFLSLAEEVSSQQLEPDLLERFIDYHEGLF